MSRGARLVESIVKVQVLLSAPKHGSPDTCRRFASKWVSWSPRRGIRSSKWRHASSP